MKNIITGAAAILLALCVSFFSHDDGLRNVRFHLGLLDSDKTEKEIEETLKLFNRNFASFFNTGGSLIGLNEFPAANMIKRRIFQEINDWKKNRRIIVYDKDVFELERVDILSPVHAVAIAREVWFLTIQDNETRKSVSGGIKANPIRVRYDMRKLNDSWRVIEYEVFDKNDDIPEVQKVRL